MNGSRPTPSDHAAAQRFVQHARGTDTTLPTGQALVSVFEVAELVRAAREAAQKQLEEESLRKAPENYKRAKELLDQVNRMAQSGRLKGALLSDSLHTLGQAFMHVHTDAFTFYTDRVAIIVQGA